MARTTSPVRTNFGDIDLEITQAEQREIEVILDFLPDVAGYTFEAALVEADNDGTETVPTIAKPNGAQEALTVRQQYTSQGVWAAGTAYSTADYVEYEDLYYARISGTDVIDATPPSESADWEAITPNTIYIQFADDLSIDWAVQPTPTCPIYGFLELSVTEPASDFVRTWKPVRALLQINYSPTLVVV